MSPRGQIPPARIVFLDSKNIVDAFGDYAVSGVIGRPWSPGPKPGGVGHDTLARLGCAESFRHNIDALADPDDRGQGYLVRQLLDLIEEHGEAILVRKHLVRTGLLKTIDALHALLGRFYDSQGRLDTAAANEALSQCLAFLNHKEFASIEVLATAQIDPFLDGLVPAADDDGIADWLKESFRRMCEMVKEAIIEANQQKLPSTVWTEFGRHFDERTKAWGECWGYARSDLAHPNDGAVGTRELVVHCLRLHAREILFQLLTKEAATDARGFAQADADREAVYSVCANSRVRGATVTRPARGTE